MTPKDLFLSVDKVREYLAAPSGRLLTSASIEDLYRTIFESTGAAT